MRRLFRSFERLGVDYLLISGQASILYGAATFSEDVDLWIRPAPRNAARFLSALAGCRARVHKLTPALTPGNMRRGHGFHFIVPSRPTAVYLDVMAVPPRVGPFASAARRARRMASPWGTLPVVSIPDLILLKRTRRFFDYEVISNLVSIRVEEEEKPGRGLLRWAAKHTCRAEDRVEYLRRLGGSASLARCRLEIAREVTRFQSRDAAYWRRIVADLRRLRRQGALVKDGTLVSGAAGLW